MVNTPIKGDVHSRQICPKVTKNCKYEAFLCLLEKTDYFITISIKSEKKSKTLQQFRKTAVFMDDPSAYFLSQKVKL